MDSQETAVVPDMPTFSGEVPEIETPEVKALEAKDKALVNLLRHPDWSVYEKFVNEAVGNARALIGVNLKEMSDEELGKQVKVCNMAADMVEDILLKAKESAKAALEVLNNESRQSK